MKSVLIDTNALVLFIAGNVDRRSVGSHRRLRAFEMDDLERLNGFVRSFNRHVSLPQVLAEASNLIGAGDQEMVRGAAAALGDYIQSLDELSIASRQVVRTNAYLRLGLTDSAILSLRAGDVTVVTTDHALYGQLASLNISAKNLFHDKVLR